MQQGTQVDVSKGLKDLEGWFRPKVTDNVCVNILSAMNSVQLIPDDVRMLQN